MNLDLRNGNCLELMKTIPDKSVDLLICDLPYGETNCKWDCKIDLELFWDEFKRIRKSKKVACIHFCSTKFGYTLIKSWEKGYKMDMVWKKRNKTGGLQSRHRPMRNHEMVYFFYDEAPMYNRDKYHKRIQAKPAIEKSETAILGVRPVCKSNFEKVKHFDPPNPLSVMEEEPKNKTIPLKDRKAMGEQSGIYSKENQTASNFEPPNPASVLEEETEPPDQVYSKKGWQKGKQANSKEFRDSMKEKGLELKYEPPNPASVLEEEDQAKQGRKKYKNTTLGDMYFKTAVGPVFEPPNPSSVLEEEKTEYDWIKNGGVYGNTKKQNTQGTNSFEPPNPASVLEEGGCIGNQLGSKSHTDKMKKNGEKSLIGKPRFETPQPVSVLEETDNDKIVTDGNRFWSKVAFKGSVKETMNDYKNRMGSLFEPANPASVLEEDNIKREDYYLDKDGNHAGTHSNKAWKGTDIKMTKDTVFGSLYTPPNPVSVVEEEKDEFGWDKSVVKVKGTSYSGGNFEPVNPVSVVEDYIEPAEDEPWSMFESQKVFIGKRHHQTEKPVDILEFFLKYWTNDDDTILDPTMGSGSTGVACKKIGNRKFIGFELDPTIFEVAKKRMEEDEKEKPQKKPRAKKVPKTK